MDKKKAVVLCLSAGCLLIAGFLFVSDGSGAKSLVAKTVSPAVTASIQPARELITELPEDGKTWYTVICYNDYKTWTNQADRRVAANFAGNARLRSLAAQTFVKNYDSTDQLYRERYQKHMGGQLPQIWVMRQDGLVAYKASGSNIPADGNVLADQIAAGIDGCCPRPFKPKPVPPVAPPVVPDVKPSIPDTVPNIGPAAPEDSGKGIWILVFALLGAAGIGGVAFQRNVSEFQN